jgi:hypothetical protein
VYTLRCTQILLKHLQVGDSPPAPPTTVLGNWYCNRFNAGRHQLIVATNERTLLTIFTPAKDLAGLPTRLSKGLGHLLPTLGIGALAVVRELREMTAVQFGRTESRSVLASMNQLTFDALAAFDASVRDVVYLDELSLRLSETPCKRLDYGAPAERARELFGVPARGPGRTPLLRLV